MGSDEHKLVTDFHITPLAVFRCLECNDWVKVEHLLPDRAQDEHTCQWCLAQYAVTWSDNPPQATRIEMLWGRLA
jgi:hypothetical protein